MISINATTAIIAVTILLSWKCFSDRRLLEQLLFIPHKILNDGEYYRLFSSGLIHGDIMHLGFNMFSLYSFASHLEKAKGVYPLLFIYIISILGGSLLSLFFNRKTPNYRALGASGGVCGIIFSSIFILPNIRISIFPIPISIPAWAFIIIFIIFSSLGEKNKFWQVDHGAHLGGAISGFAITFLLYPSAVLGNQVLIIATLICAIISSIILFKKTV